MKKQKFNISGMTCSACSAHVENAVKKLDGIDNVCVNLLANTMETTYDESKLNNKKIINAVQSAGYGAKEFSRENEEYNGEADKAKRRLILSVLFLIPLMFVSMSHMFGLLNEVFGETGRDAAVSYSIIKNDEVYTITVRFVK